jgi:hypothetical protein
MTAFARLLSERSQRADARPTLALAYDRRKSSNRGSQARTRVGLSICDGHFLAVPHQAASLLAEGLVKPGSFVTPYPILQFFTEYDAPSRRLSGMLGCESGTHSTCQVSVEGCVTINNLLPQRFDTDRQRSMAEWIVSEEGGYFEEAKAKIARTIAAQRLGRPEEFGAACAFLCSVQASYISGQNLQLDGGSYLGLV